MNKDPDDILEINFQRNIHIACKNKKQKQE